MNEMKNKKKQKNIHLPTAGNSLKQYGNTAKKSQSDRILEIYGPTTVIDRER